MYDELVKRLKSHANLVREYNEDTKLFDEAVEAIEELSRENESLANSVNEASDILRRRWIPVTERLPEKSGDYLVYSIGGTWNQVSNIEIMFCDGKRFFTSSFYCPICWMPLPELPKDGGA